MKEIESTDDSYLVDFNDVLSRINNLEDLVVRLMNPEFMYKRPGSAEYEKITDTLDYLHHKIQELEKK